MMGKVCEHGNLMRQCHECELLDAQFTHLEMIAELQASLTRTVAERDALRDERDELESERDRLSADLALAQGVEVERDSAQALCFKLSIQVGEVQAHVNRLTIERDALRALAADFMSRTP